MPTTTTRAKSQTSGSTANQKMGAQGTCDLQPTVDLIEYAKTYAREKPEVAALWCLGIGFVLGWKLKPW
ncbi:hypothetical protein [Bythopirellula polymerisocia]|uniref:Uncharacterized protein n=1 Tax=Bythopirellula polymerisocia TaxID=2528003 RepID=A0A5C6CVY7_9BACT|nr:hypothetical protein [Bythopirellula polymerisocia]TWU27677.1 hypothetical protein Pla144_24540 [Bythopirellula polymerisocia]